MSSPMVGSTDRNQLEPRSDSIELQTLLSSCDEIDDSSLRSILIIKIKLADSFPRLFRKLEFFWFEDIVGEDNSGGIFEIHLQLCEKCVLFVGGCHYGSIK